MALLTTGTLRLRPIFAAFGVGASLLLAAQLPVHATTSSETITGRFAGSVALTSSSTASFQGTGRMSLAGQSSNVGVATLTGQDASGCNLNVNNERLIAANGDELDISSNDDACPVRPGVYHGTGQWTVSGGTGRFAGRTGSGTLDGYSDFGSGTFTLTINGTVSGD